MSARPQKPGIHAPMVVPQAGSPAIPTANPLAAILDVLDRGERFLVCSHMRPDGDAVGSMLALGMVIEQMGKAADLVTADRIPLHYRQLPGADAIRTRLRIRGPYDAAILLECDSLQRTRLRGLEELFLVNIDHHITGRDFAHLNWIDRSATSVGEMVYRLARAAGVAITPEMAQCLYTTILTDTGGFCYGNVRESTFALARELVEIGVDPIAIAQQVYFSAPASKLQLLGAALRRLKRDGRLAWLWVTPQDTQRTRATEEDCEGIVNVALGMAGVDTVVFLCELPEGGIRVSLRSKGSLNVAAIAARLGGGGHQNAAGCTLEGPLPRARKQILAELRGAMASLRGKRSRQ
jgi:bifunctional oligoribonuclease and PAP phosphatase NrnA